MRSGEGGSVYRAYWGTDSTWRYSSYSIVAVRSGEVFTEALPSNGLAMSLLWVHDSAFQVLCHNIILMLRFYPSKIVYIFLVYDRHFPPHIISFTWST
jgi:hypothetical protein